MKIVLRDFWGVEVRDVDSEKHLLAAMQWLCRAQDVMGEEGGCSAGYSIVKGWLPAFPETTGYIIPTFLDYAFFTKDDCYVERAISLGKWEIKVQLPSGAVRGGVGINSHPLVFNTGQVILGWIALFKITNQDRFLKAAQRAGDWLVSVQDEDGKWSKYSYKDLPHAYHARVAWALLEVADFSEDDKYKNAAIKNITWVLKHSKENGWFENVAFTSDEEPLTHFIAYTLRGLLEASFYIGNPIKDRILEVVTNASENLMRSYELRKDGPYERPQFLPATFNERWKSNADFSCLVGNAQIAIIWLKLFKQNNDARFLNATLKILDQVKSTQSLNSENGGIRGGVAGSYPIWGGYQSFFYTNWAAKFLVDAIMLQETIFQEWRNSMEYLKITK